MENGTDIQLDINNSSENKAYTTSPDESSAPENNNVNGAVKEGKKEDGEEGKEKDKEKKDAPTVEVKELFRYADKKDVILMIFGTIFACGNGIAMPCLMIVFGEVTDLFIDSTKMDPFIISIIRNCSLTSSFGYTLEDVVRDQEKLVQLLTECNRTDILQKLQDEFHKDLMNQMSTFALYFFILGLLVIIAGYIQVSFWKIASVRQTQVIRTKAFRQIMRMEIGWFDTHEVGELNTRLSDDVNKISDGIGEKMGNFFQWMSTFFGGVIIGFVYGWKLALVIMATSPLLAAAGGFMTWVMSGFTKHELKAYAKAGAIAEEVFGAIRTVVAFGGQEKETIRYGSNLNDAKKFGIHKAMVSGGGMGVVYFIFFAGYALAFWYGSKLIREGEYTAGQMLIVFFSVMFGAFGLGNAAPNLNNLATARGAAYAIWELFDRQSEIDSASEEGLRPETLKGSISFSNVSFVYPSRPEVPVLNGLTFDVSRGESIALVGSSGCGKSTVVQLLQRFYDPKEGQIKIDDHDIQDLNIKYLRQHIGMVSQEPVLFATTIKENIMFGKEGVTEDEMIQAAISANAHEFICNLPKKYDTLVGERGAQLSGGQKQRIAIARALVRDPKILLLDEATSALDTESEAIVQEALDKAQQGRTTILIAHRLSTIKTVDHIYSIKDGRVFEQGTHDELMERGEAGIYYHLVNNQKSLENRGEGEGEEDEEELGIKSSEIALERQLSHGGVRGSLKRGISKALSKQESVIQEEDVPDVALSRLIRVNAPEWLYIILGCVAALANGGLMPAFAVIFAEILGVFAKPEDEQEKEANFFSAMFLVMGVVAAAAMFFQALFFALSGENLTLRLRKMAFSTFLRQDIAFFDDHNNGVGALCTRLATDASAVQGATGVRLGTILRSICSLGTGIAIGFVFSWQMTLLILAFIPFIAAAGALQLTILSGSAGKDSAALEEAGKVAIEAIENIRVVASLTKEPYFDAEYSRLTEKPYKDSLRKAHVIGISFSFSQALIFFAYAASFYVGAYLVKNNGLHFEDMFKVFGAIVFGAMSIGEASAFAPDYGKAKESAGRIFKLLDSVPSIDSASDEGIILGDIKGEVQFSSVQFFYPTRPTVRVLKGLDLQVQPGMKVALVGTSGCGKSTTVSLLERFYDPVEGYVTIDGKKLTDLNVQNARSKLGIVQQEPILFGTSIKENIAYGDNSTEVSMDRIIKAARDANIHSFIESLPEGYDTNVGDKGAQLSGGQKQRVAIARALVRNPKILLLDEATSALDTESEKVVQEALERAQEGRTSIVIAHRLSTIQNADSIVVIKHGSVAEQGTHSELFAEKGLYYKLHLAQQKKI